VIATGTTTMIIAVITITVIHDELYIEHLTRNP
jgi:hypothetical protein